MKEKTRIDWLDGLKGLACALIFLHHFLLIFYPSIYYGAATPSHLNGYDVQLSQSPLSVFFNGSFLVALFCMISGVVISMQVMKLSDKNKLGDVVAKRYFRLMLPLLPIGFVVFWMLKFGWFSNLEAGAYTQSPWALSYYRGEISFQTFLKSAFINTWFVGDDTLSTAYWMLSSLFYGTFLSVLLGVISWKYKKRVWVLHVLACVCFFYTSKFAFAFALGSLLACMRVYYPHMFHKAAGLVLLVIGLFLGGFPIAVEPKGVYRYLTHFTYLQWHMLGAFCVLYGIFCLGGLQKFFSAKPFLWLGKISYSLYLIHVPVLFSLSTSLFLWTESALGYLPAVLLSLATSFVVALALSWLYRRYVEENCASLQRKILGWFEEKPLK